MNPPVKLISPVSKRLYSLLTEHEKMTVGELARLAGSTSTKVSETLRRWANAKPRVVRIAGWERPPEYTHTRLVPLYALGSGPDARKPAPLSRQVTNRLYWAKYAQRRRVHRPGLALQQVWGALL